MKTRVSIFRTVLQFLGILFLLTVLGLAVIAVAGLDGSDVQSTGQRVFR